MFGVSILLSWNGIKGVIFSYSGLFNVYLGKYVRGIYYHFKLLYIFYSRSI